MIGVAFLIAQVFLLFLAKPSTELKGWWAPLLLSFPFLFYPLSLSYSSDFNEGYQYVERSILLILLPWLFYFNRSTLSALTVQKTMRFFSLIMGCLSLYGILSLLLNSTFTSALASQDAYYHIRTELESIIGLHPTYFSLLCALAFLSLLFEMKKKRFDFSIALFGYFLLFILLTGLILASSKMILSALFVTSMMILAEGLKPKAILLRSVLALSIAAILVFSIRPLKERISTLIVALTEKKVEQTNPDSIRKWIYNSSLEVISENPILGTGIGDAQNELNSKYEAKGYHLALKRNFNTHNQYLQLWLSVGLLPFLSFIASLIVQFLIALFLRNTLHIAFVVLFSMSFLTENILARQDGIFAYAFFSSFFLYSSWSINRAVVFINGRYLSQTLTGVQRFANEIVRHFQSINPSSIILSRDKNQASDVRSLSIPFVSLNGQIWEQFILPFYLKLLGSPLLINLGNSAPIFYCNSIISLHDMAFKVHPSWFSDRFQKWYNFMIPRISKSAVHILTVSEFSKGEISHHYSIPKNKISVLYNGQPSFTQETQFSPPSIHGDYALCVGSISERKNQLELIEAFLLIENPPFKLVLAGTLNPQIFKEQAEITTKINSSPHCILIEQPSDLELANLYHHAHFCIYLPIYEGFGIPVLESFAFQKPILLSDIPVFRELFEGYVLFYSLGNIDNLRDKLMEMYTHSVFWQVKVSKFDFNEKEFTYPSSAEKLTELIRALNSKGE